MHQPARMAAFMPLDNGADYVFTQWGRRGRRRGWHQRQQHRAATSTGADGSGTNRAAPIVQHQATVVQAAAHDSSCPCHSTPHSTPTRRANTNCTGFKLKQRRHYYILHASASSLVTVPSTMASCTMASYLTRQDKHHPATTTTTTRQAEHDQAPQPQPHRGRACLIQTASWLTTPPRGSLVPSKRSWPTQPIA